MIYIRVLARALSSMLQKCEARLTRISYWDGEKYIPIFEEQLPIPWSYEDPRAIAPKDLNHDVDGLLDVAWLVEPNNEGGFPQFGVLNHASPLPNNVPAILKRHFEAEENLKFDILVTGTDSSSATLSLNIHRGSPLWDNPQIGWMDSTGAIRRDSNF